MHTHAHPSPLALSTGKAQKRGLGAVERTPSCEEKRSEKSPKVLTLNWKQWEFMRIFIFKKNQ